MTEQNAANASQAKGLSETSRGSAAVAVAVADGCGCG